MDLPRLSNAPTLIKDESLNLVQNIPLVKLNENQSPLPSGLLVDKTQLDVEQSSLQATDPGLIKGASIPQPSDPELIENLSLKPSPIPKPIEKTLDPKSIQRPIEINHDNLKKTATSNVNVRVGSLLFPRGGLGETPKFSNVQHGLTSLQYQPHYISSQGFQSQIASSYPFSYPTDLAFGSSYPQVTFIQAPGIKHYPGV